jgi:putative Mg2+ transporter-C (MgtC) family protein
MPRRRPSTLLASDIPSLDWTDALARLVLAAALGGAIGVERELREREAGLRTHMLVSVGSALFTIVSAYGFHEFLASGANVVRADPSRIAAQIVTGIGFLGAGAIIRQGLSVRGLTTAATLWVVAAIGLASGAGYYSGAIITTVVVLISLWPLRILGYRLLRRYRPEVDRLVVQLPGGQSPAPLIEAVEELGGRVGSAEISQEGDRRSVALQVSMPSTRKPADVVTRIADLEGVLEVRWME